MADKKNPVTGVVEGAKKWYKSKTYIGIILTLIPSIVRIINPEWAIHVEGLEGTIDQGFDSALEVAGQADMLWAKLLEIVGPLLTVIGLRKAKKDVSNTLI